MTLKANDVVYSASTKMLYASVPSSAGADGNSITPVDPATGGVGTPVFIGSEPNRLALSNDGNSLYASLDGAFAIRRFDVQTQTPGSQFSLGQESSFYGLYAVNDIAVAPGEPNVLAVVRYYRGLSPPEAGVAIYDNGVKRPKAGPGHIDGADFLAYSASSSKLYGGGYYDGLRTMNIDATGITSITKTTFSVGAKVKLDGGLIFSSSGQVINPDTSTLLGTFSGASSYAFVPDTSVGRAYYLGRDNFGSGPLTLKAFDVNTFLPVGSQSLTGVSGDPTTLIRWGANGLAFRTTTGDFYIIQSSLIPSSTPIPTPTPTPAATPTPSPSPIATFIRQIPLTTNNITYNSATQTIFASIPSSVGASGNSITQLDPVTGTVGSSVFIGSEPTKMALSDDGQTMYVALNGAGTLRRFDVASQTPGLQFSLGLDGYYGPLFADSIAVMPGSPGTVAVSRSNAGTAVYDDGVPRSQMANFGGSLQFGADAAKLYAGGGPIQKLSVNASGLTQSSSIATGRSGSTTYFDKARGLLFTSGGDVIDPESGVLLGEFTGLSYNNLMAVDSAAGRVYFLTGDSSTWVLRAFDMNTFLSIGSVTLTGIADSPTDLVRWGTNGLAFRMNGNYYAGGEGRIVLIQTALVSASDPIPTPTPTPAGTPTPTPTPAYVPTFVRKVSLPANDLVYNAATQSLYASIPSSAGAGGNSITPIDPATGGVGTPVFVGSEPNRLALADDGRTLYTYLDGAKAIRRFDLQTQTPGLQFTVGAQAPADMDVMPGSPQTLAISPGVNFSSGVTVYDDGVARPNIGSNGGFYAVLPIEFGATPSVLYGYDSYSSGFELVKFKVDASGVTTVSVTNNLLSGYSTDIKFAGGLLYGSSGRIVDPEAKKLIGTFSAAGGAFAIDTTLGRAFFLSGDSYSGSKVLKAYDLNTFLPLGQVTIPNIVGTPTKLVRWGTNGLALRAINNSGSPPYDSAVYVIQSALVSAAQPIPTGVQLSSDKLTAYEYNPALTVTVSRTGDVSAATTVNYATSDGTANAGSDYTATSGALTFAAGELSKTINIPIKQDNVYEGNETFNVTLSDASGGALLVGPSSALVTLYDDESRPYISISNVKVTEGNAGTTDAQFLVSLSNSSVETVSVNYATSDGTASSASDYVSTTGTLTIPPLSTSALITVKVNGDVQVEPDETFFVNLSGAVNSLITYSQVTGTIANDDGPGKFQFSSSSYSRAENGGSAVITVNRVNGSSGTATVNYTASNGTATAGSDYATAAGTLTFNDGETSKTFSVSLINDAVDEPNETVNLALNSPTGGALLGAPAAATLVITDDDRITYQFTASNYAVTEGDGQIVIDVTRTGDTSAPATVTYVTSNGNATEVSDYTLTLGTLRFDAGESKKSFAVLITDDAFAEPAEGFYVALFEPSRGFLGTPSVATVIINSNDSATGPNPVGDGFDAQFFVRQHYHDFLNREPDASGLQFWTNEIESCGADAACREVKKINVSAAFFLSIEFQQTGYLAYRLHQAAFGTQEGLRWRTFLADTQEIGHGVQVGVGDWQGQLEANKQAFINQFVNRSDFLNAFNGRTDGQYVDALNANTFDPLTPGTGGVLTQDERNQLVSDLQQSKKTRADVLRSVAENAEFSRRQSNRAFVLMEFYGYMRRNPNDQPDGNFDGYNFWLSKLNQFGGNFVRAEMVKAFIQSSEYRQRFGQ